MRARERRPGCGAAFLGSALTLGPAFAGHRGTEQQAPGLSMLQRRLTIPRRSAPMRQVGARQVVSNAASASWLPTKRLRVGSLVSPGFMAAAAAGALAKRSTKSQRMTAWARAVAAGTGYGRSAASAAGRSDRERATAALEFLESQRSSARSWPPTPPPPPRLAPAQQSMRAEVVGAASARNSAFVEGDATAAFSRIYNGGEWLCGSEAQSGLGSRRETTKEFCDFLETFLRDRRITSIVDAGCGHWPSGYQRFMDWQGVHYHGVDVVRRVVEENVAYFQQPSHLESYGLTSATFSAGDVTAELPVGDVLLVKDVLMHLPNYAVHRFLRNSIYAAMPRYRMVLLVQNEVPRAVNLRQMIDIEPGQLLPFDISQPPFQAPLVDIFRWQSDEPKVVQLWERGL